MRHIDLFSGIGGFALAASWVWGDEHEIVTFCEKEEFPRKVLKKHWPDVPCVKDIHNFKGDDYGAVDLITGGFPCQPFSVAGKQRGAEDDRYLWPETLRVLQENKPRWFIGENVPGIINMALDDVLSSLESEGYETETLIIPACAVNAPHRRNRVWIVAYSTRECSHGGRNAGKARRNEFADSRSDVADTESIRLQRHRASRVKKSNSRQPQTQLKGRFSFMGDSECVGLDRKPWRRPGAQLADGCGWSIEPAVGRVANGIPGRMDRLRGLGNAIVPQVAAVIMTGIKEVEEVMPVED